MMRFPKQLYIERVFDDERVEGYLIAREKIDELQISPGEETQVGLYELTSVDTVECTVVRKDSVLAESGKEES